MNKLQDDCDNRQYYFKSKNEWETAIIATTTHKIYLENMKININFIKHIQNF